MSKYNGLSVININDAIDSIGDGDSIEIEKSPEFMAAVWETSDYLKTLSLSNSQYNHLSELLVKQLSLRAEDAYIQGFRAGIQIARIAQETPDNEYSGYLN